MENVIKTDKGSVEEYYNFINIAERLFAQTAYYWPNRPEWLGEYANMLNLESLFFTEISSFQLDYVYDYEPLPEHGPHFPPEETAERVALFKQVIDAVLIKLAPMTRQQFVDQIFVIDQTEDGLDTDPPRFSPRPHLLTLEEMREGIEEAFGYLREWPEEKWQEVTKPRITNLLQQLKTLV